MKVHVITALGAAALFVACSSSNKSTRATSDTGTTTQGSVQGTQSAAGSQGQVAASGDTSSTGTAGSATAKSSDTSSMGSDRSGQVDTSSPNSSTGSTSGQSGTGSSTTGSGSTYGQSGTGSGTTGSGSTYGQSGTGTGSSGSTYGQSGTGSSTGSGSTYGQSGTGSSGSGSTASDMGTSSSRGSMDRSSTGSSANLKRTVGRVSKVDSDAKSISIAMRGGAPLTLIVDDNTLIVDSSGSTTSDLSSIKEGSQVRASFDPASNHAQRIEVMGRGKKSRSSDQSGSLNDNTRAPNPNTAKNPAQSDTGTPSNVPADQNPK